MDGTLVLSASQLTLGGQIAEGEFASVYRGLLWGQKVAVKRLKPRDVPRAELLAELRHEVSLMASLNHPHVLTLIGSTGESAEQPSIVLEHLDCSLYDHMHSGGVDADALVELLLQLASACAYLHALFIVHRDIKPPNVLCDGRKRCKLADFGTAVRLSRAPGGELEGLTSCVGTGLYLAPEVEREQPYGLPADVFSWGCLAYELYHILSTGEDFYTGLNLFTGLETLREPLMLEPPELPVRPSSCADDRAWAVLDKCLTAAPATRPSFPEIADSLREIAGTDATGSWLARG